MSLIEYIEQGGVEAMQREIMWLRLTCGLLLVTCVCIVIFCSKARK